MGIEAYLKSSELSEQQPESKSTPWFAVAASATARAVLFCLQSGQQPAQRCFIWEHDTTAALRNFDGSPPRINAVEHMLACSPINKRLARIEDWRVETNGVTVPRRSPYRLSASRDVRLSLDFARLGNDHS
jgi:hypothetical protein